MTYESVTIVLPEHKMQMLRKLAQQEMRRPRDQAAYILCNVLSADNAPNRETNSSTAIRQDSTGAAGSVNA